MEDAHIAHLNLGTGTGGVSIFGVFDGHGGFEVAKFVEKHFVSTLVNLPSFIKGDYAFALKECFLRMDELL